MSEQKVVKCPDCKPDIKCTTCNGFGFVYQIITYKPIKKET